MVRKLLLISLFVAISIVCRAGSTFTPPPNVTNATGTLPVANGGVGPYTADGQAFVWSHFETNNPGSNTLEELFISTSTDGINWFTLNGNASVFTYPGYVPSSGVFGAVRDTALTWDGAQYVVVHTPLDAGASCHSFRVLTSPDLIHWTHVYDVPCPSTTTSGSAGYGNPVWITDLSSAVHVMYTGSIDGAYTASDSYVWEIHPTVAGVYTAWSTPVAVTTLGYCGEIYFFLSPDDSNYHVIRSNSSNSHIQAWHCSTLTGSYTLDTDLSLTLGALNTREGLNVLRIPSNGSTSIWRLYSELNTGYSYCDLSSSFVPVTGMHAINTSISPVFQKNGKWSVVRLPVSPAPAVGNFGSISGQDADNVGITGGTITGASISTAPITSTGQFLGHLDNGYTTGGLLMNASAPTTCAFIGEFSAHTLGIVLGSASGYNALNFVNNARSAAIASMDNSGDLSAAIIGGTTINASGYVNVGQYNTNSGIIFNSDAKIVEYNSNDLGILFPSDNKIYFSIQSGGVPAGDKWLMTTTAFGPANGVGSTLSSTGLTDTGTSNLAAVNISGLTASKPVFTDGSKNLVSGANSVPQLVASGNLLAQSATVASVATYTTPNDSTKHTFRFGSYTSITAVSAGTLTLSVTFTDENGTSRTVTEFPMGLTTAGLTATGFTAFPGGTIRCNPNTAITVVATFSGVSITYDVGATIESVY